MEKSPEAFRTISEVADLLDTPAHVLRFWESRFPQVRPVKRAGGRRYYRPADVALLAGIRHLLHDQGMTIRGVQKILRDHGVRHVSGLIAGSDSDGGGEAVVESQDAAPDNAGVWLDAELPENDDRRVIPWPGKPASDEAGPVEAVEPPADTPHPVAEDAPAVIDPPTEAPETVDLSAEMPDLTDMSPQAPVNVDPQPDLARGAANAAPETLPGSPPATDLSGQPDAITGPAALPFVQGELFADLPQVRPPAPAVIEPAEPDSLAEPAPDPVVPGSVDAALAEIRPLTNRIRHLPPAALASADLAPLLARLVALRDRMHAQPRS